MTIGKLSPQDYNERIHAVKQYIQGHTHEPLNREVLATVAGFSAPVLMKVLQLNIPFLEGFVFNLLPLSIATQSLAPKAAQLQAVSQSNFC